jgi:hypothetical protein
MLGLSNDPLGILFYYFAERTIHELIIL